ncbi:hypothetical protein HNQ60_003619 [Povalibacter uvarum]|uniref:Uncharacterized protein n=1 Tax=Povalibacter uvarum TaxID=732238 RepID=A0A841HRS5_9GAMM|nr:hypothetical protein [Povalibacter uvarum]MBB6094732.1 hypothetical protein [Povalibacter uvarum]
MPEPWVVLVLVADVIVGIAIWRYLRSRRSSRKRPVGAGFGWALLFLSSGRMPPPPPQSQIEQEAGERKNRGISERDP